MQPRQFLGSAVLMCLVALPLKPPPANGCAAVWSANSNGVLIAEEGAIILWDAAQKMQHFIRWARFDALAADFGFLVPTPTVPVLAEASEAIFSTLEQWTAPKTVTRKDWTFMPLICAPLLMIGSAAKEEFKAVAANIDVRVLHQQTVGGFEAVVLEADDGEKLRQWLDKNGYVARPELTSWLGPYLAEKWKITAFKIAHDPKTGSAHKTTPVRMSFRTERPFFPYREPEETKEASSGIARPRLLRVFFVGDLRVQAKVGDMNWPARVPWTNTLDDTQRTELAKAVNLESAALPAKARLTVFEDSSSPRAGKEEVFFDPAADQSIIERPPIIVIDGTIWIPADMVALGLAAIGLLLYFRSRRRRAVAKAPI